MFPIALVFSEGDITAKDICENIIKATDKDIVECSQKCLSNNFVGYICNLKNKYYKNCIILLPLEIDANDIELEFIKNVESVIIYLDTKNKEKIQKISQYSNFMRDKNIKNGLLLLGCHQMQSKDDITFEDIKADSSLLLDVIEMNIEPIGNDKSDSNFDFKEVLQTLYTYEWSNIEINKVPRNNAKPDVAQECSQEDTDIDDFEKLFLKIQAFKSISTRLHREEVLNQAEKLANNFNVLMNCDADDL